MSRPQRGSSSRNRSPAGPLGVASLAVCFGLACPSAAKAADDPRPDVELRHDLWIDVPVTVALLGGTALYSNVLKKDVVSSECRWCGVDGLDEWVRDALVRDDPQPAKVTSDIVAYGVGPVAAGVLLGAAAAQEGRLKHAPVDLVLVAEATSTALAINEVVKSVSLRERPHVHAITDEDAHAAAAADSDGLASFTSGHTLSVFALTASAGTISAMRGYRLTPLIWVVGSMVGVTAAYLRIAADRHYLTDTLAGAALGMTIGAGVPLLFHRPKGATSALGRATITTSPVPSGRVVSLAWTF